MFSHSPTVEIFKKTDYLKEHLCAESVFSNFVKYFKNFENVYSSCFQFTNFLLKRLSVYTVIS